MYRILVTDDVDRDGLALLAADPRLRVDEVPTLPPAALLERIGDYDAIVGRSATKISPELLEAGKRLKVVGRAGVGVDNVAMDVATALGVAVINAPAGNTVAVAELFFGAVIGLLRELPRAHEAMRAGRWDRGSFVGAELKGRTIGIAGLGRIGGEIAGRAHAFGAEVVAFDPYVADGRFTALRVRRAATLDALADEADVLTVHTPLTDETRGLVGRRELGRLKPGSIVVNMARGGIVDEGALLAVLEHGLPGGGALRGAVLDVYTSEPPPADHPLRALPNVFLTPHLGANTAEAQRNVAVDVCAAVRDALVSGELSRSMNVAGADGTGDSWAALGPAMLVARRAAAVARAVLADLGVRAVQRLTVRTGAGLAAGREALLGAAALGAVEGVVEQERLNLINARAVAAGRGLELAAGESGALAPNAVEVSLRGAMQELTVAGVAPADGSPRLTRIGAYPVDVNPRQTLLVLTNRDVPGVIGRVGTLLGHAGVNIAEYHQARLAQGGEALAVVAVDGAVSEAVRAALRDLPEVHGAAVAVWRG
ncbi:D-3-phosphoglycerate dehydrogenase [Gemmatimonadetes bacterium T265]|nr:D-3-phosphoglycerate dehydrogenase [Gemmatimonadetes bacterium T265]